jgi:hypothetical protein
MVTSTVRNGGVSGWYAEIGIPEPRSPLPGDVSADVAIVGARLTGPWSAYYLQRLQPDLRIVLVEREFAGQHADSTSRLAHLGNLLTGR